jgi:hypothetical protein
MPKKDDKPRFSSYQAYKRYREQKEKQDNDRLSSVHASLSKNTQSSRENI